VAFLRYGRYVPRPTICTSLHCTAMYIIIRWRCTVLGCTLVGRLVFLVVLPHKPVGQRKWNTLMPVPSVSCDVLHVIRPATLPHTAVSSVDCLPSPSPWTLEVQCSAVQCSNATKLATSQHHYDSCVRAGFRRCFTVCFGFGLSRHAPTRASAQSLSSI
jgi:hypothetical protein